MGRPKLELPKQPPVIDGVVRTQEVEDRINEALAITFRGENGAYALNYLRSITTNFVNGPGIEPDALMHREGARWLFGVIQSRIQEWGDRNV